MFILRTRYPVKELHIVNMQLETTYKILANIINFIRHLPIKESLNFESQCGFSSGRGCIVVIFSVKRDIGTVLNIGFCFNTLSRHLIMCIVSYFR